MDKVSCWDCINMISRKSNELQKASTPFSVWSGSRCGKNLSQFSDNDSSDSVICRNFEQLYLDGTLSCC